MTEKYIYSSNTKQSYNVLILIGASWGEVDWILPVCRYIKDNYPWVTISVIFKSYDREDIIKGNDFLYDLLTQSVDNCYDLNSFLPPPIKRLIDIIKPLSYRNNSPIRVTGYARHRILTLAHRYLVKGLEQKIVNVTNPDVFLKDTANDEGIRGKITSLVRERGGSVVMFPHGTPIFLDVPPPSRDAGISHDVDADILLCSSESMSKAYGRRFTRVETAVVGTPRYDSWWIKYVRTYWEQKGYSAKWDSSKQYAILFITRGPHPQTLSRQTFEYLVRETARTVLSFPDTYLLVRPHPRSSSTLLEEYLKEYDRSRWTIDLTNPFCLAGSVDLVISMWSSMTLDALAVGIPVIEFFRFEGSNQRWSQQEDGTRTTEYRELGLVVSANNGEELLFWVNKFRQEPDVELKKQLTNFRKQVPESMDSATRLAANFVLGKWREHEPPSS